MTTLKTRSRFERSDANFKSIKLKNQSAYFRQGFSDSQNTGRITPPCGDGTLPDKEYLLGFDYSLWYDNDDFSFED